MEERPKSKGLGPMVGLEQLSAWVEADPTWQEGLDEVAALACRLLDVAVAQVNVVFPDRQRSLSSVAGRPEWNSWGGPRDVLLESSYCKHVVESGEPLVIENSEADPLVKENLATTESGIRSYAAVPLKNDEGVTLGTLCVASFEPREWEASRIEALSSLAQLLMREIRGRIEAERNLQAGEARFRALIENGEDLITILDADRRILYASPAYQHILGYDANDLTGTSLQDLVHPSDVQRWTEEFSGLLVAPSDRASGEWRMRHRSGDWRVVDGSGVNLLHEPAVRGLVFNMMDITAEKQIARKLQQSQKMEAVGRLAGGMAHDFNNLLTAIKGNSSFLLARGDISPEAEEDFREMLDAVKRASSLTRQLLAFSRDQPLDIKGLDLGEVAEEIVPLVTRLLGAKVRLKTGFERDLPILADEGQVGQVIMNLAVNARDAMPEGGTLRIETRDVTVSSERVISHSEIQPGRYVQLVVADDGVGMTQAVQNRMFDPFYTTKPKGKGTGLGLSIIWGVIKQLNGHVHVYSEPGRGTTFRIYFPWADQDLLGPEVEEGVQEGDRPEVRKAAILVVEDQPEISRITERILVAQGHTVFVCESGEEALELASTLEEAPDLLLSDVLLPGITGPEAAWELLERWPNLAVVFTSGYTQGELASQDVELRAARFLPKPFGQEELTEAVAQALRRGTGERGMPSDAVPSPQEEPVIDHPERVSDPVQKGDPVVDPEARQFLRDLGTVHDVPPQRERKAELQRVERLASVGTLASGIAHQFNNLLMTVQGHLWVVRADLPKSEPYHEDFEAITQAVDRAAALAEQLLAFSGRLIQPAGSVDLNSNLRRLIPKVREIVADDTDLVVELAPGVGSVMINADQLEQVILIMAKTAREVMHEGSNTVAIRTQVVPGLPDRARTSPGAWAPSHYVLLTISHIGFGAKEEALKHPSGPFFRTEGWNEEWDAGLADMYGIVRGSGGHIDVACSPDDGCHFSLYLAGADDSKAPDVGHRSPDIERIIVDESGSDDAKSSLSS